MTRRTIFSLTALVTVSLLVLLCGNVQAAWIEDFESYPDGLLTSSPWDAGIDPNDLGTEQLVTSGAGFTGKAMVGNNLGNVFRAADSGATELTARVYSDTNFGGGSFSRYYVGFHTEADSDSGFPFSDSVIVYMSTFQNDAFLSLETSDYDAGVFIPTANRATDTGTAAGVLVDTWYDVRITLNPDGTTADGDYKLTTSGTWLDIGTGTVDIADPINFSPNFVGIAGQNSGRIDDISVDGVPEPSSLVLILLGLTGLTAYGWGCRRTG